MFLIQEIQLFGYATTGTAVSNVTISKYLSIDMSTNLSSGISFGNISALPAVNLNASNNYDFDTADTQTSMVVNLSTDSNINIDLCIECGTCEMNCPFEAIIFLDDAEYAKMIAAEQEAG